MTATPTTTTSSELLEDVRKARPRAIEALLEMHYPMVHRLAHALVGRADGAGAVVSFVLSRSLPNMVKWVDEAAPHRWFSHHTLLTARRAGELPPDPKQDLLVLAAGTGEPGYVAFIRALRTLPRQQMESFILTYGERCDARQMAIAMDCSIEAAVNHLQAGERSLKEIAGEAYGEYVAALERAHGGLTPAQTLAGPAIRPHIRRHLRPRLVRRILWGLIAAIIVVCAVVAWVRYG